MKCELNARLVATLQLPDGKSDELFWDTRQAGLALRVRRSPNGDLMRTWVCQRKRHGKVIKVRLGRASEIGIDQARRAARDILGRIDLGHNPGAERRAAAAKEQRTMAALVAEYLETKKREVRPRTLTEVTRYLQGPYFKPLHGVPVHEIDRARIASSVKAIVRERGAPTAREARNTLNTFFVWAMGEGLCESNPVIGTNAPKTSEPRDRVLSDDELRRIWLACGDDDYGRIIKLLILLGARRQEIGGMRRSEFDSPESPTKWTLPSARSKNKRELALPLVSTAVAIIRSVPRVVGRDQLFGVRASGGYADWGGAKARLDKRSGVHSWAVHDLRRTFSTRLNELDAPPWIVEAILNHSRPGMEAVHNRAAYRNQMRDALLMWEAHVLGLARGERKVLAFAPTA
jgi:integrase